MDRCNQPIVTCHRARSAVPHSTLSRRMLSVCSCLSLWTRNTRHVTHGQLGMDVSLYQDIYEWMLTWGQVQVLLVLCGYSCCYLSRVVQTRCCFYFYLRQHSWVGYVFVLFVRLSVCHDCCRNNQPIPLKLGVMIVPISEKIQLTFGGHLVLSTDSGSIFLFLSIPE